MRKLFFILTFFVLSNNFVFAGEYALAQNNKIQNHINEIGTKILNANKFEKRVVFVYDDEYKIEYLKNIKSLTKRQVVVYENAYKGIANDDELAAYIAREIPAAIRSYDGLGKGWLSSIKIKAAPKKFELVFDKLAVDYMVKAGYNPLGLITYINKTAPQARQDMFSSKNLTSKRLAYIYEKIYSQYPNFLINNDYIENEYYQNFLLTSLENRKKVQQKINAPQDNKRLKYE